METTKTSVNENEEVVTTETIKPKLSLGKKIAIGAGVVALGAAVAYLVLRGDGEVVADAVSGIVK